MDTVTNLTSTGLISIVIPVFNEQHNVCRLYSALVTQLSQLPHPCEIIFVDDGSVDDSLEILRGLSARDPRARVVSLSRNFGHQIAITAGMEYATGDAVIVMDADFQHPPELIPEMVGKWKQGFDVVYTVRTKTEGVGLMKRATSYAFYKLVNCMTRTPIIPNSADFRLLDRRVVDCLKQMKEHARFIRGMVSWSGFKQTGIPFVASARQTGTSNYSVKKMLRLAIDGVTGFSSVPLRLAAYLGFIAAISGLPYGVWALYVRLFTDVAVPGWTSLIVIVLFLGGVQLVSLGIIGQYIGRIYEEVMDRPLYLTQELIGFDRRGCFQNSKSPPTTAESSADLVAANHAK